MSHILVCNVNFSSGHIKKFKETGQMISIIFSLPQYIKDIIIPTCAQCGLAGEVSPVPFRALLGNAVCLALTVALTGSVSWGAFRCAVAARGRQLLEGQPAWNMASGHNSHVRCQTSDFSSRSEYVFLQKRNPYVSVSGSNTDTRMKPNTVGP